VNTKTERMSAAQMLIDLVENPETAPRMPRFFPVEFLAGETVADLGR